MNNWTVENWLSLTTIFLAIVAGGFTFVQWRSGKKIRRAEFIEQLIERIRVDDKIAGAAYIFDYNIGWYDNNFHSSKKDLVHLGDCILSYLSYICYLRAEKILTKSEFRLLEYEVHRACSHPDSQCYLWNIFHFSRKIGAECPYQPLIDYGINKRTSVGGRPLISATFLDPNATAYTKRLNF